MSATHEQLSTAEPSANGAGPAGPGLRDASLAESLAVILVGVVPALVRGLFSPRPAAMKLLTRIDADGRAIRVLTGIRRKRDGQGVRLLGGRLVVLWGTSAIREVLDNSADLFASDAGAKAKGMSHFQPDALTLSRGEVWRDRRAFNEAVLASRERVHPLGRRFVAVVGDEVRRLSPPGTLTWPDWERLFDHITLRVIFGDHARDERQLTARLERLMAQANQLVGSKPGDDYYELYGALERELRDPEPDSLLGMFAAAPHSDRTRVVQQIPHWMFAMRDTLGANAYRALAAIVADPALERRVRAELAGADLSDPATIDGMRYLEGCLQEAMRLWPTTPLVAREATKDLALDGDQRLPAGTQILILNVFNHRDPEHVEDADRLVPERWAGERRDYRFNHLSNGRQDCPGGPLVLLLGKAVIAYALACWSPRLERPAVAPGRPLPAMLDFFDVRLRV
jgi:cytochrome P450